MHSNARWLSVLIWGETYVFKNWSDIFWGILLLMCLLTQGFWKKKSSRSSFFLQEQIKHIFLLSAHSVCRWELLMPKFSSSKATEVGRIYLCGDLALNKPLYSWNIDERKLENPSKFQLGHPRLSWAMTDNKWYLAGRDYVVIFQRVSILK